MKRKNKQKKDNRIEHRITKIKGKHQMRGNNATKTGGTKEQGEYEDQS
jgi:hypothetical protein